MLTKQQIEEIHNRSEIEGFEYEMLWGSDYEEITDKKFHKLLAVFRQAREDLADYVEWEE